MASRSTTIVLKTHESRIQQLLNEVQNIQYPPACRAFCERWASRRDFTTISSPSYLSALTLHKTSTDSCVVSRHRVSQLDPENIRFCDDKSDQYWELGGIA
ncbi:hypothetical protein J6590_043996 [Homalodisca vitripennis]|nr:hypothetical protein J6590_043996 [Homalodisca vitripennis]